MKASTEKFFDYYKAERYADRIAGDNPGLIVWLIETWDSLVRYEDGEEGDLYVLTADSVADGMLLAEHDFPYWEEQYDATKSTEPPDLLEGWTGPHEPEEA